LAADENHAEAQFNYAHCLEHGQGVQRDLIAAAHYYHLSADQNFPKAQCAYALCLEYGKGVQANLTAAAGYYRLAASQNFAEAQLYYADCLENGKGVHPDLAGAARYYELAAEQNLADAQLRYALCLENGRGVAVDLVKAARYYKLAARQNIAMAQFNYAVCLENGRGVDPDLIEAANYYRLAADQNHADAQFRYALLLSPGGGVQTDLITAAKYYRLAADQNHVRAQVKYAICLQNGEGAEMGLIQAVKYFKRAADQNDVTGQVKYGECLLVGRGVALDFVTAVAYFRLAADQNVAHAQLIYARCLATGKGAQTDFANAAKYYQLAADQGLAQAQWYCAACFMDGQGVPVNRVQAMKYLKFWADQNIIDGQFIYARHLVDGRGRYVNRIEAARYFRLAGGLDPGTGIDDDERLRESMAPLSLAVARAIMERCLLTRSFDCLNSLGICLEIGHCAEKDVELAAQCYEAAATGGHSGAQTNYGCCLSYGIGVESNLSKSVQFYAKAMDEANPTAVRYYALSVHFGSGCCEDVESALDHYDFLAETSPSMLATNAIRCIRGLNKLPPEKATPEQEQPLTADESVVQITLLDIIAGYQVESLGPANGRILGEGASGRVTCERHPKRPENQIAVKRFQAFTKWSLFMREVEALVKLRHPCIVPILGWSRRDSNLLEIQMKYAANGALSDHLGHGSRAHLGLLRDPTRRARLLCEIVMGMEYIHSRGLIHRDLKPANILLDEDLRVMICDFGLSRSRSATGLPTPNAGTFEYAAPEQWQADKPYTGKVDVFTFGLIAYELIAGEPVVCPRQPDNLPERPPSFGPLMQNLIGRCWSLNPSDRPSFRDIFLEFKSSGWEILPGISVDRIAQSVSEVTRRRKLMKRLRVSMPDGRPSHVYL
jgi:TPR repeat protein